MTKIDINDFSMWERQAEARGFSAIGKKILRQALNWGWSCNRESHGEGRSLAAAEDN